MEVNAVMAQSDIAPSEAKQEDRMETGNFASRLKEAGGGQKPETADEVKNGGKGKQKPCGGQAKDENGEKIEIQTMVCIPVCVQETKDEETGISAGTKPDEGAAIAIQPDELILAPDKDARAGKNAPAGEDAPQNATAAPDTGEETFVLKEAAPVIEKAPAYKEAPDKAEEFAGKALREMKQQLAGREIDAENRAQTVKYTAEEASTKDAGSGGRENGPMQETTEMKKADLPQESMKAAEPAVEKEAKSVETQTAAGHPDTAKTVLQPQAEVAVSAGKTAPDAAETPGTPVRMENMFSEIVERVATEAENGKSELFVQLKPEHLGGLSISLAMGEDGLTAKIVTGQQSVNSMLHGGIADLQEALREKGIQVAHMEIQYDAGPGTGNPSGGRRDWTAQPGFRIAADAASSEDAATFYYNLSSYEVLAEQGGSVEFSA